MKKFLFLAAVLLCFVRGVNAWNETSFPAASFRSTSSMVGAGSSLPMAAQGGARLAGNAPQMVGSIGSNRSPMDDAFGGETIYGTENPDEPGNAVPIGDALLPLLALIALFVAFRLYKRRRVKIA